MTLHGFKNSWEEDDVLRGVVHHVLAERSALPEQRVLLHLYLDLFLLGVLDTEILLQKIIEGNIVIFKVDLLITSHECLCDCSMCYLCVEDEVRNDSELVNECKIVFTEVMEKFQGAFRCEYLLQSVRERIKGEQVKEVTCPIEVQLQQGERPLVR